MLDPHEIQHIASNSQYNSQDMFELSGFAYVLRIRDSHVVIFFKFSEFQSFQESFILHSFLHEYPVTDDVDFLEVPKMYKKY